MAGLSPRSTSYGLGVRKPTVWEGIMPKKTDWEDLTDKEQEIVQTAVENPDMTHSEIADETDSSESYVGETRREYEDHVEVVEKDEDGGKGLAVILMIIALGALYLAFDMGIL